MPQQPTVALLVSRCPSVIEQVTHAAQELANVQVDVCSVRAATARAEQPNVGLIFAHLGENDPGIPNLIWGLAQHQRACPTVVLCNRFEEQQALALLRAGAADYVTLPAEGDRLRFLLNVLTHRFRACSRLDAHDQGASGDLREEGFAHILSQVRRVATQDTTVLLSGETGTGKTRLARLIHDLSPRRAQPFLVVDCSTLSAGLIESDLFGHVRGAFSSADRDRGGKLAAAGAGTILLDEINSLPANLQSKLLRAVEERVFEPVGSEKSQALRARILVASNVPLLDEVHAGRFRADLYYRLDVVHFSLPALRERRGSIVPLARGFLQEFVNDNGQQAPGGFSQDAERLLNAYEWPGNIRELRNVVERAVTLCPSDRIEVTDLPDALRKRMETTDDASPSAAPPVAPSLSQSKDELEIQRIREALDRHPNRTLAARELGISRVGLYKKLRRLGLQPTDTTVGRA